MRVKSPKKDTAQNHRTSSNGFPMSTDEWEELQDGVEYFNKGEFLLSHETWERMRKRQPESARPFFQGLLQLAAAYHQITGKMGYRGLILHFEKAGEKLAAYEPHFFGIYVKHLMKFIELGKEEAMHLGEERIAEFNANLIPRIQFHLPNNPDLIAELQTVYSSAGFLEGLELFNTGYYWEAHEVWEDLSRELDGDSKVIVQALVQTASAYSFIKLARPAAAVYLFEKAIEKLEEFGGTLKPLEIEELLEHMRNIHQSLALHPGMPLKLAASSPVPHIKFK